MLKTKEKYGYVLNTKISALKFNETVNLIEEWITENEKKYVCVCNTHSLVTAYKQIEFQQVLDSADLCIPDGMPLVWAQKINGYRLQDRVDGPNLMLDLCKKANQKEYKIYLYGSSNENLKMLEVRLKNMFSNINIVGKFSPPFRKVTHEEQSHFIQNINDCKPDLVFVSLGCPKQEKWMFENKNEVNGVMLGVGAAFDFITGNLKRPPIIFQKMGMEWLFRLLSEPKRLFKRYAYNNTMFVIYYILTSRKNRAKMKSLLKQNV